MRWSPDPNDESDQEYLADLNAEPWMVDLLKLNPDYTHWGPHEDCMWKRGDGWESPVLIDSWKEFEIGLDNLNECVNFYFQLVRNARDCPKCEGAQYNPETKQICDDFYDFARTGRRWRDNITQDEVDALVERGRLRKWDPDRGWESQPSLTAEEVNNANREGAGLFGGLQHDAINKFILIETRAKRLGVYGFCVECEGRGSLFTEDAAHVELVLWVLHPRKGASRGVEIKMIEQEDLPSVYSFLRQAAERNAERFSQIPSVSGPSE